MSYKINKNKYLLLKILEKAKNKGDNNIVISDAEYEYLKANLDSSLKCEVVNNEYYWYVGQDHPSTKNTIITNNNRPGWRFTGTTLDADYEFNTTDYNISDNPTRRAEWYIALPVDTQYYIWDDQHIEQLNSYYETNETVMFNNVSYKIYKLAVSRAISGILIKK